MRKANTIVQFNLISHVVTKMTKLDDDNFHYDNSKTTIYEMMLLMIIINTYNSNDLMIPSRAPTIPAPKDK